MPVCHCPVVAQVPLSCHHCSSRTCTLPSEGEKIEQSTQIWRLKNFVCSQLPKNEDDVGLWAFQYIKPCNKRTPPCDRDGVPIQARKGSTLSVLLLTDLFPFLLCLSFDVNAVCLRCSFDTTLSSKSMVMHSYSNNSSFHSQQLQSTTTKRKESNSSLFFY